MADLDPKIVTEKSERDRVRPAWRDYYDAVLGFRNYWYPAVFEDEVSDVPTPVTLLGERLLVRRIDDKIYAVEDRCAHRLVPLSKKLECYTKNTITCWYHGWTYDFRDGTIHTVLTEPNSALVGKPGIKSYPVEVTKGLVFIWIGDGEPGPLANDVPPAFLDDKRVFKGIRRTVDSNWRWGCENGFDSTHIYIHRDAKVIQVCDDIMLPLGLVPTSNPEGHLLIEDREPKGVYENTMVSYTPVFSGQIEEVTVSARMKDMGKVMARGGPPPVSAGSIWLPCGLQIETALIEHQNQFEFYVPINETQHMYFQVLGKLCETEEEGEAHKKMVDEVWEDIQLRGFNDEDIWAREGLEDAYTNGKGWTRERLFKPDTATVKWRQLASKHNRGIQPLGPK